MNLLRLVLCLALSVPAAWFAAALVDRVPERRPLWHPWPPLNLVRDQPAILVVMAGLFTVAAWRFADAGLLALLGYLGFFVAAVALSVIDLRTLRLPDVIVGGAMVVSLPLITLVAVIDGSGAPIRHALLGAALYSGVLFLAHLIYPPGMGFGDVKAAALLGLYLGWVATDGMGAVLLVLYAMLAGFLVGSLGGAVLFAIRRRSQPYPFGPFLIAGAVTVLAFSADLLPPVP